MAGNRVENNFASHSTFRQRFAAGLLDDIHAVLPNREENFHKLPVTALIPGKPFSDPGQTNGQVPFPERCSVSECAGFTLKYAQIMPGIVNNMITAKLPGMIGNNLAVADHCNSLGTGPYCGRLAGKSAVDAVMITIVSDQAGA